MMYSAFLDELEKVAGDQANSYRLMKGPMLASHNARSPREAAKAMTSLQQARSLTGGKGLAALKTVRDQPRATALGRSSGAFTHHRRAAQGQHTHPTLANFPTSFNYRS